MDHSMVGQPLSKPQGHQPRYLSFSASSSQCSLSQGGSWALSIWPSPTSLGFLPLFVASNGPFLTHPGKALQSVSPSPTVAPTGTSYTKGRAQSWSQRKLGSHGDHAAQSMT